jgi:type VI protein secretion system component Hcp
LTDVLVSSFSSSGQDPNVSGDGDDRPTEEVSFYYNRIAVVHVAEDGSITRGEAGRTTSQ